MPPIIQPRWSRTVAQPPSQTSPSPPPTATNQTFVLPPQVPNTVIHSANLHATPQTHSHSDPPTDVPEVPSTRNHNVSPQSIPQTHSRTDPLTDVSETSAATHSTLCLLPMTELPPLHQPAPRRRKQSHKFIRYNHNTRHSKTLHPCSNTHHVVNLSSHRLSKNELSVLNKGLNFVPTPPHPQSSEPPKGC